MPEAFSEFGFNPLAVLMAAASAFLLGGIWYGPLFGARWQRSAGLSDTDLAARRMPVVFALAAVLSLLAAANLEAFIGPEGTVLFGLLAGAAAGVGWVATFLGIIYVFEARSLTLYLINAGYSVVALSIMGIIHGAW